MKICPACRTQYSDDTLLFCLQDGSRLEAVTISDMPTIALSETETVVSPSRRSAPGSMATVADSQKSRTGIAVAATAAIMLVIFAIVGAGAWLYLNRTRTETNRNSADAQVTPSPRANGVNQTPTPAVKPSPVPSPTPAANIEPAAEAQMRKDIAETLESWRSGSESLDLDDYMEHYAPTVDYYNKPGASAAFVRADKERAFSRYDTIWVGISEVTITPGNDGVTATAEFDKEWEFRGAGRSTGKVRQMLKFRKIDGEWLIVAEKDLKLYYKR